MGSTHRVHGVLHTGPMSKITSHFTRGSVETTSSRTVPGGPCCSDADMGCPPTAPGGGAPTGAPGWATCGGTCWAAARALRPGISARNAWSGEEQAAFGPPSVVWLHALRSPAP